MPLSKYVWILIFAIFLALSGCGVLVGSLPPAPSPFPTFPRLPSVTPAPPSPTPGPTRTPRPTALPQFLEATVAVGANIRSGPDVSFDVVSSIAAENQVTLLGQRDGWYQIETVDGIVGWMSGLVLEVPPTAPALLPVVGP